MRNLVLSADKLSDITICPRRHWFKHELRKIPASKPKYLSEGELFHSILEYYYNDIMKERKQNNGFYIEIARNKAAEFSDLNIEESELLVKILIDYLNYYANESWKILGVEAPFAKVFIEDEKMDLRVIIRGKSDLVVDASGNKAIVDHKVVSQNRAIFGRNNQNLAYSPSSSRTTRSRRMAVSDRPSCTLSSRRFMRRRLSRRARIWLRL